MIYDSKNEFAAGILILIIPIFVTLLFFMPRTVNAYYFLVIPTFILSAIAAIAFILYEIIKAIKLKTIKQSVIAVVVTGVYGFMIFYLFIFLVITHGGG